MSKAKDAKGRLGLAFYETMLRVMQEPLAAEPTGVVSKLEHALRKQFKSGLDDWLRNVIRALPQTIELSSPLESMSDEELVATLQQLQALREKEHDTATH
jgi:hypothetical protein